MKPHAPKPRPCSPQSVVEWGHLDQKCIQLLSDGSAPATPSSQMHPQPKSTVFLCLLILIQLR